MQGVSDNVDDILNELEEDSPPKKQAKKPKKTVASTTLKSTSGDDPWNTGDTGADFADFNVGSSDYGISSSGGSATG